MTTEQLIWIAITLWIMGVMAASILVFAAFYVGDEDRTQLGGDITSADDD